MPIGGIDRHRELSSVRVSSPIGPIKTRSEPCALSKPPTRQALILVGGLGTRLGALTADTPKPLLEVGGRVFLDYVIDNVWRHGFRDVVLLGGFRADKLRRWAEAAQRPDLTIRVVAEPQPAGTAGALIEAKELLEEEFFLLNGDSIFDINLLDLAVARFDFDWTAAVVLRPLADASRFGVVDLAGDRITGFVERPPAAGPGVVNGGIYRLKRSIIQWVTHQPCSLERDVFPELARRGTLAGRVYDRPMIDIGVPDAFRDSHTVVPSLGRRGGLFLDRDGVLNRDIGYPHRPDQIEWGEGAFSAVKLANDAGLFVFVVTNQAGVARGYFDEDQVIRLHHWMNEQLRLVGAHVDEFVYCPYHPTEGIGRYRRDADCRKPKPGMILDLLGRWPIAQSESFLVGDKESDMQAAAAAGVRGILYAGGDLADTVRQALAKRSAASN